MSARFRHRQSLLDKVAAPDGVGMTCCVSLLSAVLVSSVVIAGSADLPMGLHAVRTGAGEYMLAEGSSLYWNDKDVGAGEPTCLEECAETWIPVQAPADAQNTSDWSIAERADGIRQWVYRGKPLYRYSKDTFPGARLGDGLGRIWHLMFEPINVPGSMTIESTLLGRVLADHRGRTLYTNTPTAGTAKIEAAGETGQWEALAAPWLAAGRGDWTIQTHSAGTRQWAYKGQSLFTYEKDTDPQDIRGHGLNGAWSAVILEPAPGLPSWVTIQQVDLGLAFADERGMTVYVPRDLEQIRAAQTCPAECMQELWRPVLAAPDEASIGDWVIVENDAGQRQWSFEGRFLYTHTRDRRPGDMIGNGYAVGYRIGDGWRVILVDPRDRARL